jgi:hypothetical protein
MFNKFKTFGFWAGILWLCMVASSALADNEEYEYPQFIEPVRASIKKHFTDSGADLSSLILKSEPAWDIDPSGKRIVSIYSKIRARWSRHWVWYDCETDFLELGSEHYQDLGSRCKYEGE